MYHNPGGFGKATLTRHFLMGGPVSPSFLTLCQIYSLANSLLSKIIRDTH